MRAVATTHAGAGKSFMARTMLDGCAFPQDACTREILVVPYHTIAFSQQKLRAALRRSGGQEPSLTYGFVVHSRRQHERPTLGVITLNGESLPLNRRLLAALEGLPLWLFGHARVTLR